jgi:hypothetical protein
MAEKIMTKHPRGLNGVNIDRQKYDVMRAAILEALRKQGPLTFTDLTAVVHKTLDGKFDGSISWYATTVKLDLEARKQIKADKSKPPKWRVR